MLVVFSSPVDCYKVIFGMGERLGTVRHVLCRIIYLFNLATLKFYDISMRSMAEFLKLDRSSIESETEK